MPQIAITLNGRSYRVGCGPGEEDKLQAVGRTLDARMAELAKVNAQAGETQLLVVAALTLMDELGDAAVKLGAAERLGAGEARAAAALEEAAARIEGLADRLESS